MNASALNTRLDSAISAAVAAGEILQPQNQAQAVRDLVNVMQSYDLTAQQNARDLVWSNEVSAAVKAGRSIDASKIG